MWNTAVNVNAWLAVTVCNKARGGRSRNKEAGKDGEKREKRVRTLTHDAVTGVTKREVHLAKTPHGVKSITATRRERQLNPNMP